MAKIRRIIRKLEVTRKTGFDDRFWPVVVAMIVLSGFLVGLALAVLRFDDPRWYFNAWTSLFVAPVMMASGLAVFYFVDHRLVRRATQFSLVMALIIHLVLLVIVHRTDILTFESEELAENVKVVRQQKIVPDYQSWQINRRQWRQQDHLKPVETENAQPRVDPIERLLSETEPTLSPPQPTPVREPKESVKPSVVERAENTLTAPRQNEQASLLSRQLHSAEPRSALLVTAPRVTSAAQPQDSALQAQAEPVRRQQTALSVARSTETPQPTSTTEAPRMELARRQASSQPAPRATPADSQVESAAQRSEPSSAAPSTSARVEVTPASSAAAQASQPRQARQTPLTNSPTSNSLISKATTQPTTSRPNTTPQPTPQAIARRQPQGPASPTVSQSADSAPVPRSRSDLAPGAVTSASPQTVQQAPTSSDLPQPRPSSSAIARQPTVSPVATMNSRSLPAAARSPSSQIANAPASRAPNPVAPNIQPQASPSRQVARATRNATEVASPAHVESPAVAQAERSSGRSSAQPARMALSQSFAGVAGTGRSVNLDSAVAAADSPAQVASGSIQRARATQTTSPGAAISPSETARLSRSRAEAQIPTATLTASAVALPTDAGVRQPSQINASASAALTEASANADTGSVSAAKGNLQVDLGPTRTVSEQGVGRAAGGGQPELNFETPSRDLARSETGGSPLVALATDAKADLPTAPRADGGGQPPPLPNNLDATAALHTQEGASEPLSGGPSNAARQGPSAETSTAVQVAAATLARAEMAEAAPGQLTAGGGQQERLDREETNRRRTRSDLQGAPVISLAAQVEPSTATSSTASEGAETVAPADVEVSSANSTAENNLSGPRADLTVEAPSAASQSGAAAGESLAERSRAAKDDPGPLAVTEANRGAPLSRSKTALPSGSLSSTTVEVPSAGEPAEPTTAEVPTGLAGGGDLGPIARSSGGALTVDVEAAEGPGGLADAYSVDVGLNSRRARRDSPQLQVVASTRFQRQLLGGAPSTNTSAVVSADSFRGRTARKPGDELGAAPASPGPQTEKAIDLGLLFLSRHQSTAGNWSLNHFAAGRPGYEEESASLNSDTAATGLALLAFQGAGFNHREHMYRDAVSRGIDWLLDHQKADGDLYVSIDEDSNRSVWLYSHSIAALALCEAYGMTQDPRLREPAQKSLDFIAASQHQQRGGWRYSPGVGSDTSVSGWMMMALKSGDLANLEVDPKTYIRIEHWLDDAQVSKTQRHLYRYNPYAPDTDQQRHGRQVSPAMTSVGLLMRLYSGWRRDHASMIEGADFLKENLPAIGTRSEPRRDTYYWYYATQVMFHMGGDYWQTWNENLRPLLTEAQVQQGPLAGSWNPRTPVPDRWGPLAGRIYVTTMNLLSLEVYYRLLPLYDDTAK